MRIRESTIHSTSAAGADALNCKCQSCVIEARERPLGSDARETEFMACCLSYEICSSLFGYYDGLWRTTKRDQGSTVFRATTYNTGCRLQRIGMQKRSCIDNNDDIVLE